MSLAYPKSSLLPDAVREPWRPIHYLGSKLRVLEGIREAVDDVAAQGSPVCDLFAGSGTVSGAFAHERQVTAVDVQEYSRIICAAILRPAAIDGEAFLAVARNAKEASKATGLLWAARPMIELEARCSAEAASGTLDSLCELLEMGSLVTITADRIKSLRPEVAEAVTTTCRRLSETNLQDSVGSVAFRHFGGTYFSFGQAAEIDVLLNQVSRLPSALQDVAKAAVLTTASQLVNTIGKQFAQPLRPREKGGSPKKTLYSLTSRDRTKNTFEIFKASLAKYQFLEASEFHHNAVRSDYREFLVNSSDRMGAVYADPPYTRDHYSRFYHVLETLALRDNPNISTNKQFGKVLPSRGVYRLDRHQSPFCIRSLAPSAFSMLFELLAAKRVPLVLSYSPFAAEKNAHPRVMEVEAIGDLARKSFASVEVRVAGPISHSRLNKAELNKEIAKNAELLFLCKP